MSRGKERQTFFLIFLTMILYGQEGLKKYSLIEILKSALGKNNPTVYSVNFLHMIYHILKVTKFFLLYIMYTIHISNIIKRVLYIQYILTSGRFSLS